MNWIDRSADAAVRPFRPAELSGAGAKCHWVLLALSLVLWVGLPGRPQAQSVPVSVATLPQGSMEHSLGTLIGKELVQDTRLKVLVLPYAGVVGMLNAVENSVAAFAVVDINEVIMAAKGQAGFEGRPLRNVRLAMPLIPMPVALFVREKSKIHSMEDFRGKRLPQGKAEDFLEAVHLEAIFAAAGFGGQPFVKVTINHRNPALEKFMRRITHGMVFTAGGVRTTQVGGVVGTLRAIPVPDTPWALAAVKKIRPAYYISTVLPSAYSTGVSNPTPMVTTDAVLVVNSRVPDQVVRKVLRVIHFNARRMTETFPAFKAFSPKGDLKPYPGMEYHPGAIGLAKKTRAG